MSRGAKVLKKIIGKPISRFIFNYWDWTCVYCGRRSKFLTLDHVVPKSKNGLPVRQNLVPACYTCNLEKGTRNLEDFTSPARIKEIKRYMTLSKKYRNTYNLLWSWYSHPDYFRW